MTKYGLVGAATAGIVRSMHQSIANRVIVVTGAARGIGQAIAMAVLGQNGRLVALDRRWDEGDSFYESLRRDSKALALSCDIESDAEVAAALQSTLDNFGPPEVLINNAAMRQRDFFPVDGACTVLETTHLQWERMFAVNVLAQIRITRAFIGPMLAQRRGAIINISAKGGVNYISDDGQWTMAPHLRLNQPYDASKAAFTNMSFYLAEEVRSNGIAVNVVFPGAIRSTGVTEMEAGRQKLGIQMSLAEPTEVVPVVMHLAAQDGNALTGVAFDSKAWNRKNQPHQSIESV